MNKHRIIKWFVVLIIFFYLIAFYNETQHLYFWLPLLLLIFLYSIIIFLGSYFIQLNFFVKAFNKGVTNKKQLALTFDDGPHENTLQILALLKKFNVKASFFIIGKNIAGREEILKKIIEEGHLIGNHSYEHNTMYSMKSALKMRQDILKNKELLFQVTGKNVNWFRPPYGVTNPIVAKALSPLNLDIIGWNVRSLDTTIHDEKVVLKRIIDRLKGGDIVLLHDTIDKTAQVLDVFLLHCQNQKIEIIPLDQLINRKAYA